MAILFAVLVLGSFGVWPQQAKARTCSDYRAGFPPATRLTLCVDNLQLSNSTPKLGERFNLNINVTGEVLDTEAIPNPFEIRLVWLGPSSVAGQPEGAYDSEEIQIEYNEEGVFEPVSRSFTYDTGDVKFRNAFQRGSTINVGAQAVFPIERSEIRAVALELIRVDLQPAEEAEENTVEIVITNPNPQGLSRSFRADFKYQGDSEPTRDSNFVYEWGIREINEGRSVRNQGSFTWGYNFPRAGTYTVFLSVYENASATDDLASTERRVTVAEEEERTGFFDGIVGGLISVVNIILGVIVAILRWVVLFIGSVIVLPVLESTLSMEAGDIAGGPILAGWQFVRDFVNMFFILILIVIGFATMLRIENYNYRKLLVTLIMMALLVNFSLVIGRIIIEIADVAQFTFLPVETQLVTSEDQITTGIDGLKLVYRSFVTAHISNVLDGFRTFTFDTAGALAGTLTIIFQFMLELGVVLTFAALAVFMVIRTVALWILLVLSPLAFALAVLPATKGLSSKWWTNFIKYVLFAPIIAFFLRLSLFIYQQGFSILPKSALSLNEAPEDLISALDEFSALEGGITFDRMLELLGIYVLVLAFMWAGLIVARNMGIAGANSIVGYAGKAFKFGGVAGTRFALRGTYFRSLGKGLDKAFGTKGAAGKPGRFEKMLGTIPKVTSYVEGAPGTMKRAFDLSEKARQKEVVGAQRAMLKRLGFKTTTKDDFEAMNSQEIEDLLTNPETKLQDIMSVIEHGKMHELFDALNDLYNDHGADLGIRDESGVTDQRKLDLLSQAFYRRIGGSGLVPAAPAGGRWQTGAGGRAEFHPGGSPAAQPRSLNADLIERGAFAFERDLIKTEVEAVIERNYKLARDRLKLYKQALDNPELEKELFRQEVEEGKMSLPEALRWVEARDSLEKRTGERVAAKASKITGGGQRVIMSEDVVRETGIQTDAFIEYDESRPETTAEFKKFTQALKKEGVSETEVAKVVNTAKKMGGVAVQRGHFASLSRFVEDRGTGREAVRTQRLEPKQHERTHGFYTHIKQSSSNDYKEVVNLVTQDKNYSQLKQQIISKPQYKGLPEEKVVEEVLTRRDLRGKLSDSTRGSVEKVIDKHQESFKELTREVLRDSKVIERSEDLRQQILGRLGLDEDEENNNE